MPLVRPLALEPLGRARTGGAAHSELKADGGAEPRLTSGGEAVVEGVKSGSALDIQDGISHPAAKPEWRESSQDQLLIFKTVSHPAAKPEWMESSSR